MKKKMLKVVFVLLISLVMEGGAKAATVSPEEITIYALNDKYQGQFSIDKAYPTTGQIKVTGNIEKPTFYLNYGTNFDISVSEDGVVSAKPQTFYCKEENQIVTCKSEAFDGYEYTKTGYNFNTYSVFVRVDGEEHQVKVHVENYAAIEAQRIMLDYIDKNITSGMSEYQKMERIAQFVASYPYNYSTSYVGLILGGGADCIGSSNTMVWMAKKVGITAHVRWAANDPGSLDNHHNVFAILDGKSYIVEVGYNMPVPRMYDFTEVNASGWIENYLLGEYQYDGYEKETTIPTNYDFVHQYAIYHGAHSKTILETIHVPKEIHSIDAAAFSRVYTVKNIEVDESNENYKSIDGVLYSKDGSTLHTYASGREAKEFIVDKNVTEIYNSAFSYNNKIEKIVLPEGLKRIGASAFENCTNLKSLEIPSTVEELGRFSLAKTNLASIVIPSKVSKIDEYTFYNPYRKWEYIMILNPNVEISEDSELKNTKIIYGYKNSTAQNYALKNNIEFIELPSIMTKVPITEDMISGYSEEIYFNESGNRLPLSLKYKNKVLKEGSDYTLTYENNNKAGDATVTIEGINNFIGKLTLKYHITKIKIIAKEKSTILHKDNKRIEVETNLPEGVKYTIYYRRAKNYGASNFISFSLEENDYKVQYQVSAGMNYIDSDWKEITVTVVDTPSKAIYNNVDYSKVFDYEYYLSHYSDVANKYKTGDTYDYAKVLAHFVNYGMKEGRQGSKDFNVYIYQANYADLYKKYKSDFKSYYMHYINHGATEGRNASTLNFAYVRDGFNYARIFDINYYLENNSDVATKYKTKVGYNYMGVFNQFLNYGMKEGRKTKDNFDVYIYQANYADIYKKYGTDLKSYYLHYMNNGYREKRNASTLKFAYVRDNLDYSRVLDINYYLENNKDVASKYKTRGRYNYMGVFNHFLNHGMKEGRKSSAKFNVKTYKNNYKDLQNKYGDDLKSYYIHYIKFGYKEGRKAI